MTRVLQVLHVVCKYATREVLPTNCTISFGTWVTDTSHVRGRFKKKNVKKCGLLPNRGGGGGGGGVFLGENRLFQSCFGLV